MKEEYKSCISAAHLADTGFSYTLSLINGKYKMTILYTLMCFGVVRFNEMKKYIEEFWMVCGSRMTKASQCPNCGLAGIKK